MRRTGLFLLLLVLAIPALAGVVFELETKTHESGDIYDTELKAQDGNMAIGIAKGKAGGKDGDMVYRGDRREMVVVDHEHGTYSVLDEQALRSITGMASAISRRQQALENVPEDKRAMIEEMMEQKMQARQPKRPESELQKTDERATHNGYPCVKYIALREGRKVRELWVTDWSNIEGGADVAETFDDMADFFEELMDSIPDFGGQQDLGDPTWLLMKDLGGFPVVTRDFEDDGSLEGETALRSAKRQTIDPDAFEPPSGYKRQEMFGFE